MRDHEAILASRWLQPVAHLFSHPSLWHLNRRTVPRAVAVGLFIAFVLPVGQFVLAAFTAVITRANVPLAAAATLISNPITFAPIYLAAYKLGSLLLGSPSAQAVGQLGQGSGLSIAGISAATALGLVIFSLAAASIGYVAGTVLWRLRLTARWKSRRSQNSGAQAHVA